MINFIKDVRFIKDIFMKQFFRSVSRAMLLSGLFLSVLIASVMGAERILVVGDSITGHSMNLPYGFTHEVRSALTAAGVNDVEFVPLGGSGQTIISWQSIIENSYNNSQQLDIKGIKVKEEFDKGADTVLVHLGMNDALRPTVVQTEKSLVAWKSEYQKLISTLKKRLSFKKLILSPPTMLTESPYYYKNALMDDLARIVKEVARENKAEFLDIRGDFQRHFETARMLNPNFRITLDFVHPNQFGHQIMTWSILRGIGQNQAAEKYYKEKTAPEIKDFKTPGLSLFVLSSTDPDHIQIKGKTRGIRSASDLKVTPPAGLKMIGIKLEENGELEIILSGHSSALSADLTIEAGTIKRTVKINAPYLVLCNFSRKIFYSRPEDFKRETAVTEIDRIILAEGKNLTANSLQEKHSSWLVCFPSSDATGAANPCAVDFCTVPLADAYDAAYLVRRVYSPKDQNVKLKLNSEGFSTTAINTVYLNGKEIYFGCLSPRHIKAKDEKMVSLKKGWNVLAARVDHTYWQWAMSFAFEGENLSY